MMSDLMRRISFLNALKNPSQDEAEELEFYKAVMIVIINIFRSKNYCTMAPKKLQNCSDESARKHSKTLGLQIKENKTGLYVVFTKEVEI